MGRNVFPRERLNRRRNYSIGGETSYIEGETSHIGAQTSSEGAKRLTGELNVLSWDKSSRRRGRSVLKMSAKRLGGRSVHGAKCSGAVFTPLYFNRSFLHRPHRTVFTPLYLNTPFLHLLQHTVLTPPPPQHTVFTPPLPQHTLVTSSATHCFYLPGEPGQFHLWPGIGQGS